MLNVQLGVLMRLKAIPSKSEAIRMAVAAQAKAVQTSHLRHDFLALVGLIKPKRPGRFTMRWQILLHSTYSKYIWSA